MADVSLTFRGQDVGAVQTTKSVESALEDLSVQSLQTSALLHQALDGINGDPAEREVQKVTNEMEQLSRQALSTAAVVSASFLGINTFGTTGQFSVMGLAMASLIPTAIALAAAMVPALFAIGAAIAPAAVALLALPAAMGAVAVAAGAMMLAFQGVGDALKAGTALQEDNGEAAKQLADQQEAAAQRVESAQDAVVAAHRRVEDAQHSLMLASRGLEAAQDNLVSAVQRLRDAEDDLSDAIRAAKLAQEDLSDARKQAVETLIDLGLRAEGAALAERRAILSLSDARADLAELEATGTATADQLAAARLRVEEAELRLTSATIDNGRAQEDLTVANKNGIDQAPGVIAAKDNVKAANDRVELATRGVQNAEKDVTDARFAVTEAAYAVEKASQNLALAQEGVRDSNREVVQANKDLNETLSTLTGPMQKFRDAMANLSPPAQDFVNQLLGMKPLMEELRTTASAGIFPGLTDLLQGFERSFGSFKSVIGEVSVALGGFFSDLGAWIGSSEFQAKFEQLGGIFAQTITDLGDAFISFGKVFIDLSLAAGPFLEWVTTGIARLAEMASAATSSGLETGKLAGWFDRAREAIILVWNVLRPLVEIIWELGQAAAPVGREILKDLADALDRISDWTNTARTSGGLGAAFSGSADILRSVAGLLGDIILAIGRIGKAIVENFDFAAVIAVFRDTLLPAVERIATALVEAFGPTLESTVKRIAEGLAATLDYLTPVVEFLGRMLNDNPALQAFVGSFVALYAVSKLLPVAQTAYNAAIAAWAVVTGIATAAQWLWNTAMSANPIGVVVVAIAALVAGVILAYKESETFRNIVDRLWAAIKDAAAWVVDFSAKLWDLISPLVELYLRFNPVLAIIREIPDAIRGAVGFVQTLIDAFNSVIGFLRDNWREIIPLLTGPFVVVTALATDAFGIRSALIDAFNGILTWIRGKFDDFKRAAANLGGAIKEGVVDGVTGIITAVSTILARIVTWLGDRITAWRDAAFKLGKAIYNGIVNALTSTASNIVTRVKTIITNAIGEVTKLVTRAGTVGRNLGSAIFNGAKNALSGLATTLRGLLKGAINAAIQVINSGIGRINSALEFEISMPLGLGSIDFDPKDIPSIPYLARGGVVSGPTLAMLGDNPGGREAVIPLPERGDLLGGGGGGVTVIVQGSVIQERDLGRTVRDAVTKATRKDPGFMGGGLAAVPR